VENKAQAAVFVELVLMCRGGASRLEIGLCHKMFQVWVWGRGSTTEKMICPTFNDSFMHAKGQPNDNRAAGLEL